MEVNQHPEADSSYTTLAVTNDIHIHELLVLL